MKLKLIITAVGFVTLVGCSSRDSSVAQDRADAFLAMIENPAYSPAIPVTMPSFGSATYNGYGAVYAETGPATEVFGLGIARVDVNFGTDTVSGTVDRFVDENSESVGGSLTFNDVGNFVGNSFSATGFGAVVKNGQVTTFNVSGSGDFAGQNADALFVYMDGTATTGGYTGFAEAAIAAED